MAAARRLAQRNLLTPIDDVWAKLKPLYSPAFAQASTGLDGKKYFVPIYNYPWAVFYRRSLFKAKGYSVPKTWDQFIALAKKMKADMIVHATHGRTGLSHLLMGSVAERVLRTAPCPVLTLRSDVAKRAVRKKAPAK